MSYIITKNLRGPLPGRIGLGLVAGGGSLSQTLGPMVQYTPPPTPAPAPAPAAPSSPFSNVVKPGMSLSQAAAAISAAQQAYNACLKMQAAGWTWSSSTNSCQAPAPAPAPAPVPTAPVPTTSTVPTTAPVNYGQAAAACKAAGMTWDMVNNVCIPAAIVTPGGSPGTVPLTAAPTVNTLPVNPPTANLATAQILPAIVTTTPAATSPGATPDWLQLAQQCQTAGGNWIFASNSCQFAPPASSSGGGGGGGGGGGYANFPTPTTPAAAPAAISTPDTGILDTIFPDSSGGGFDISEVLAVASIAVGLLLFFKDSKEI